MDYFSLCIGSVFILAGMYLIVNILLFNRNTVLTYGIVLRNERKRTYYPVVEFVDASEQSHTFTDDFGSSPEAHQPGSRVRVRYHPEFPHKARVETRWRWMFVLIFILAGIFILLLSFGLITPNPR
jgi:hypothetical protein